MGHWLHECDNKREDHSTTGKPAFSPANQKLLAMHVGAVLNDQRDSLHTYRDVVLGKEHHSKKKRWDTELEDESTPSR